VDVVAGSRWSRRVPDDATIVGQARQDRLALPAGAPSRNDGTSADSDPDGKPDEPASRGSDQRSTADCLVADPWSRGLGADGSTLRPAEEWLTPEDLDPGSPSTPEAAERLRLFLATTSVHTERKRMDGHAITADVREAVSAGATVAALDRLECPAWFRGERESGQAPRSELVVRHRVAGAGRPEDVMASVGCEARWTTRRAFGLHKDRLRLQKPSRSHGRLMVSYLRGLFAKTPGRCTWQLRSVVKSLPRCGPAHGRRYRTGHGGQSEPCGHVEVRRFGGTGRHDVRLVEETDPGPDRRRAAVELKPSGAMFEIVVTCVALKVLERLPVLHDCNRSASQAVPIRNHSIIPIAFQFTDHSGHRDEPLKPVDGFAPVVDVHAADKQNGAL